MILWNQASTLNQYRNFSVMLSFTMTINPKIVKNDAKTPLELKTSLFENMVFYLHGSMEFKGSGLPKSPKIIRKQAARTM